MISTFLSQSRQAFSKNLSNLSKLTIVSGNQSADLDSIVSSITFSYLSHSQQSTNLLQSPSSLTIPLLNIPKADLCLRKDVEFVLSQASVPKDDLFFLDDLESLPKGLSIDLILVDHNEPQGDSIKSLISSNTHKVKVVGIIDHHDDEGLSQDANPRVIKPCGSCNSLVLDYFLAKGHVPRDVSFVKFVVAPILIDTGSLTQRVEATDVKVVQELTGSNSEVSTASTSLLRAYYEDIQKAKSDIKGLSFRDVLRKDYKEFQFGKYKVGISSIVKRYSYLSGEYTFEGLVSSLESWKSERSLDLSILMTSFLNQDDNFTRELGFLCSSELDSDLTGKIVAYLSEDLQLTEESCNSKLIIYKQGTIKASRKQVAPLLKDFLESL